MPRISPKVFTSSAFGYVAAIVAPDMLNALNKSAFVVRLSELRFLAFAAEVHAERVINILDV